MRENRSADQSGWYLVLEIIRKKNTKKYCQHICSWSAWHSPLSAREFNFSFWLLLDIYFVFLIQNECTADPLQTVTEQNKWSFNTSNVVSPLWSLLYCCIFSNAKYKKQKQKKHTGLQQTCSLNISIGRSHTWITLRARPRQVIEILLKSQDPSSRSCSFWSG